jgi:hypothetical protein
MTEAIEAHLILAREAAAQGRAGGARNSWARAAALSHALRHLSDLDRAADHLEQALAHAEQAAALYSAHGQGASLDMANALRLKALALDSLRRADPARAVWKAARELYAGADAEAGVADCDARLAADAGG